MVMQILAKVPAWPIRSHLPANNNGTFVLLPDLLFLTAHPSRDGKHSTFFALFPQSAQVLPRLPRQTRVPITAVGLGTPRKRTTPLTMIHAIP